MVARPCTSCGGSSVSNNRSSKPPHLRLAQPLTRLDRRPACEGRREALEPIGPAAEASASEIGEGFPKAGDAIEPRMRRRNRVDHDGPSAERLDLEPDGADRMRMRSRARPALRRSARSSAAAGVAARPRRPGAAAPAPTRTARARAPSAGLRSRCPPAPRRRCTSRTSGQAAPRTRPGRGPPRPGSRPSAPARPVPERSSPRRPAG